MHIAVHFASCDSGRHRLAFASHWNLCAVELLGFFHIFRNGANIFKPGFVDILVSGQFDRTGRGAKLAKI